LSPNRKSSSVRNDPAEPAQPDSFESTFAELQQVVEQLERGALDLDHVVQLYDRGTALAQTCERLVANAELRVTRLAAETASPLSDT
jgi:exodeoxyribonuclease VII small subunit